MNNVVAPKQRVPLTVKWFRICPECIAIFSFMLTKTGCGCMSKLFTFKCNKCGYTQTWRTYKKPFVVF